MLISIFIFSIHFTQSRLHKPWKALIVTAW